MIELIFSAIWFFLPVGMANIAPVFAAHISWLKKFTYPLDGYRTFRGKRIFGEHKTIRGLLSGIILAILTVLLQRFIYDLSPVIRQLSMVNYDLLDPFVFGILCGLGAILGDAIESFFKRQLNIPPGKSWFPFDQIDYILGAICLTAFYIPLSLQTYLLILFFWFLMHLLFSYLGFLSGFKKTPI